VSTQSMAASSNGTRWQPDYAANECPICARRFTTFLRKHHCRLCGRVVCYHCSLSRMSLDADTLVMPPEGPAMSESPFHRVCDDCVAIVSPSRIIQERSIPRHGRVSASSSVSSTTSSSSTGVRKNVAAAAPVNVVPSTQRISRSDDDGTVLTECPVCLLPLQSIESESLREEHVNHCLTDIGSSPAGFSMNGRYLVYTLKSNSALIGTECVICFEEFNAGDKIARLECLCNYHRNCIRKWFSKSGPKCPVHRIS